MPLGQQLDDRAGVAMGAGGQNIGVVGELQAPRLAPMRKNASPMSDCRPPARLQSDGVVRAPWEATMKVLFSLAVLGLVVWFAGVV